MGKMRVMFVLAVAALLVTWKPTPVATAPPREKAADALAAQGKLFCHRTFRATGWTTTSFDGGNGKRELDQDPTDNTLCGIRSDGYASVWSPNGTPTVATGLNGLPAMETTFYYGAMTLSIDSSSTPPISQLVGTSSRVGYRYYRWQNNADICWQGKLTQMHNYWGFSSGDGGLIWGHPGGSIPGANGRNYKSKWYRWEEYFAPGYIPGTTSVAVHIKNITDNGPEYSGSVPTQGVFASGSTYSEPIHEYRDRNAHVNNGPCTNRYMYLLVAKNLGPTERIPPAVEVEGGTVASRTDGGVAPSAPSGLTLR